MVIRKSSFSIFIALVTFMLILPLVWFATLRKSEDSKMLTVTSDTEATFEFSIFSEEYENGREDFKNQTSPFQMDIPVKNCRIQFKKISGNSPVNFRVEDETGSIEGHWSSTEILIQEDQLTTYQL